MKLRRKDVQIREYKGELTCLVKVHKSSKTGSREVNGRGGEYVKRVMDKSKFKKKDDFIFTHLDGSPFTTRQFGKIFKEYDHFP